MSPVLIEDDPNTDADETANIIVLGTVKEDIDFGIVDEFDISVPLPFYPAVSEQQIRFRFEAENTTIQEGGSVWFNIPKQAGLNPISMPKTKTRV